MLHLWTLGNTPPPPIHKLLFVGKDKKLQQPADGTLELADAYVVNVPGNIEYVSANEESYREGVMWISKGKLFGLGYNAYGGLGIDTLVDALTPTQESLGKSDWVQVICGTTASMAMDENGKVWTCGRDNYGQLGLDPANYKVFTELPGTWESMFMNWPSTNIHVQNSSGEVWVAGYDLFTLGVVEDDPAVAVATRDVLVPINAGVTWQKVSRRNDASIGLATDGKIYSCGENFFGKLGRELDQATSHILGQIGTATNWVDVEAGADNLYALNSAGELWGSGDSLTLNMGVDEDAIDPMVLITTNVEKFAVGHRGSEFHNLAMIKTDGTLWGIGTNRDLVLGFSGGDTTTLTQIGTANNWTDLKMGWRESILSLKNSDDELWIVPSSSSSRPTGLLNTGLSQVICPIPGFEIVDYYPTGQTSGVYHARPIP